jgi:uncharacterized protein with HEPN domain
MPPEARKFIWDARQAARRLREFTAGKQLGDYLADALLRSAVERQFEIIGEALRQVARVEPASAARIPDLPRIVAFRNILVHGYASVDDRLVWGLLESELPALSTVLEGLLEEP